MHIAAPDKLGALQTGKTEELRVYEGVVEYTGMLNVVNDNDVVVVDNGNDDVVVDNGNDVVVVGVVGVVVVVVIISERRVWGDEKE